MKHRSIVKFTSILFLFLLFNSAKAQVCSSLSGNYILGTQTEVDNFTASLAGCTIIPATVVQVALSEYFATPDPIVDLSGFINIEEILGNLTISTNGSLFSLDGLDNLKVVNSFSLQNNSVLNDISALSNLESTNLTITSHRNLDNLDGLCSLSNANLSISNLPALTDTDDLLCLTSLDHFSFFNTSVTNLDGLLNLTTVGDLTIGENRFLTNIDGLSNVVSITGDFRVYFNQVLELCCSICPVLEGGIVAGNIRFSDNLPSCNITVDETFCTDCSPLDQPIPTLSQWALFILGLMLLCIGVVSIKKRGLMFINRAR